MQKKRKVNKKVLVVLMLFLLIKQIIVPLIVSAQSHEVMNGSFISESLTVEEENREEQSQQVEENAESTIEDADALSDTSEPPETDEITDEQPPAPEPVPESEKVEDEKEEPVPESEKVEDEKEEPSETEKPEVEEDNVVEEDEYNPGAMLDGFPAIPHSDNPASIIRYAQGSLGSALALLPRARMMTLNTDDLAPGEVRTSKTAMPVPGMVNTWDITVRLEGRDDVQVETTDIVLVIDRSGSMANNNRMVNAKAAAINFINTMIPADDNLRIAIVSYSSSYGDAQLVTVNREFTRNINQLKSSVNSLTALGGTHTQAGIIQGQSLLIGSDADNKYMVLLSDGEPTYSYEPSNWANGRPSWGTAGYIGNYNQRTGRYDGEFNTGRIVGTGGDITQSYNWSAGSRTYRRHIHNGLAAIKAGEDARDSIGDSGALFTIAVEAGTQGTSILEDIASKGFAYSTQDPGELTEIYESIASQIETQYALRFPRVIDEMGDGFTLIESTLNSTEGVTSVVPATGSSNQTINWAISPTVTTLVPGSTDVRFAEMTYRVEVNDDILALPSAKTDEHKLFNTNKLTELSYTDTNDEKQTKPIESPEVDPVLLRIKKVLEDEYGNILKNDPRLFHVAINHDEGKYHHTESLVSDDTFVWLTTLRHEGSYHTQETGITGVGTNDLTKFQTTYIVDGKEQQTFLVNHDENKVPRKDVEITVINQLIPLTTAFSFTKTDGNGNPLEGAQFTLDRIENNQIVETVIGTGKTTFTFDNLKEGTYRLTETVAPDGYHLPTTSWEIIIVRNTALQTLEIQLPDDLLLSFDSDRGYEIKNERQAVFPDTGASGVLPFVVVGMIITASFTGYYNKKEKQWRRKR
ncbi:SpaA isopeptide-forming pilin-related protein [Aerococcus viridans]|uniref:SpaA isopeptide-forming pilin-related protein n=1 Tax=Aerococcus viridans TaxID=1377 RepID=UPI003AA9B935